MHAIPFCISYLYVPIEYRFSDWADNFVKPYGAAVEGEWRTTAVYHPVLETTADIKKLRKPKLEYLDWKKTDENYEAVSDVFGELLPVHKGCPFIGSTDFRVFGWGLALLMCCVSFGDWSRYFMIS